MSDSVNSAEGKRALQMAFASLGLGLASLTCLMLTAIPAIILGWKARKSLAGKSQVVASAGIGLGVLGLGWTALFAFFLHETSEQTEQIRQAKAKCASPHVFVMAPGGREGNPKDWACVSAAEAEAWKKVAQNSATRERPETSETSAPSPTPLAKSTGSTPEVVRPNVPPTYLLPPTPTDAVEPSQATPSPAKPSEQIGLVGEKPQLTVTEKFDALLAQALEYESFERKFEQGMWAVSSGKNCAGKRHDLPSTSNEFENRRLLARRDQIRQDIQSTLVKVEEEPSATAKYDFDRKVMNFEIKHYETDAGWPRCGKELKFKVFEKGNAHRPPKYIGASCVLSVPMTEAEAEWWVNRSVNMKYISLHRAKALAYHHSCRNNSVWGMLDGGFGAYWQTTEVGRRIIIDGKVVEEVLNEK